MNSILIAALFAASSYGTVESVREVPLAQDPRGFAGVFELSYKPLTADELSVRLDDGRSISVMQDGMRLFAPGQRVRVVPNGPDMRVEHADGHPLP
jgi:outer membrane lipoprotein SlyB